MAHQLRLHETTEEELAKMKNDKLSVKQIRGGVKTGIKAGPVKWTRDS